MDYIIKTEEFEGPFELLLDLIKKRQMNIYDLHISLITRDYLDKLSDMAEHDIDVTSDFMEMASILLEIKSKMLIPLEAAKEDPRDELVKQLLDYQEYKESLEKMRELSKMEQKFLKRQRVETVIKKKPGTLADILKLYQKIMDKSQLDDLPRESPLDRLKQELSRVTFTVEQQMDVLTALLSKGSIEVIPYFRQLSGREERIATFGALLELIKIQVASVALDQDVWRVERKGEG